MKAITQTSRLKKDINNMQKSGKSFACLQKCHSIFGKGETLDERLRDHKLFGDYIGTGEYHIEPDWLLIYETHDDEVILIRTGTHSDLFG